MKHRLYSAAMSFKEREDLKMENIIKFTLIINMSQFRVMTSTHSVYDLNKLQRYRSRFC